MPLLSWYGDVHVTVYLIYAKFCVCRYHNHRSYLRIYAFLMQQPTSYWIALRLTVGRAMTLSNYVHESGGVLYPRGHGKSSRLCHEKPVVAKMGRTGPMIARRCCIMLQFRCPAGHSLSNMNGREETSSPVGPVSWCRHPP